MCGAAGAPAAPRPGRATPPTPPTPRPGTAACDAPHSSRVMRCAMPLTPTLPDRLRGGDATALLELAHATHARALAVARASSWGRDPEALLLDAYVALWLRRADAPAAGAEGWALAEVLAYCARHERSAQRDLARRTAGAA